MRSSLLVLLVACGGSSATTNPSNTTPGGSTSSGLPAAYAGLFASKTLTFPATFVGTMYGETPETATGTVTCVISDVADVPNGKSMQLACTSDIEMPASPSGMYVGTSEGLWYAEDGDATKLDPRKKLLGTVPVAGVVEHKDPSPDMESGEVTSVEAHNGGWCIGHSSYGGDEGGWKLCVKAGQLVGGSGFFAGGSSRDLYFGDVKK